MCKTITNKDFWGELNNFSKEINGPIFDFDLLDRPILNIKGEEFELYYKSIENVVSDMNILERYYKNTMDKLNKVASEYGSKNSYDNIRVLVDIMGYGGLFDGYLKIINILNSSDIEFSVHGGSILMSAHAFIFIGIMSDEKTLESNCRIMVHGAAQYSSGFRKIDLKYLNETMDALNLIDIRGVCSNMLTDYGCLKLNETLEMHRDTYINSDEFVKWLKYTSIKQIPNHKRRFISSLEEVATCEMVSER